MTIEQHLRILVGDLVLRVAQQAAEIDALQERLAVASTAANPLGPNDQPLTKAVTT